MKRIIDTCLALAAAVLLILVPSCSDDTCYDNRSALPLAQFHRKGSSTAVQLSGVSVGGIGVKGDSLLVDSATVSEFNLPLPHRQQSCRFKVTFTLTDADNNDAVIHLSDTLTVAYSARPYFASRECGAMYYFDIESLTSTYHVLDSVAIASATVTNVSHVNFRLFLPAVINE